MEKYVLFIHFWNYFFVLLAGVLITSTIMDVIGIRFMTMGKVPRKFTIFDLEFPATQRELVALIQGIDLLGSREEATRVKKAFRMHLYTDFLFMFCVYPGVAMLCLKTASKMDNIGDDMFLILAAMQGLAWLFDIIENVYLLNKLRTPIESSAFVHKMYKMVVITKWGMAIAGAVCSIFGLLYFWIIGEFSPPSANVPFIILLITGIWIWINTRIIKIYTRE